MVTQTLVATLTHNFFKNLLLQCSHVKIELYLGQAGKEECSLQQIILPIRVSPKDTDRWELIKTLFVMLENLTHSHNSIKPAFINCRQTETN